MTNPDQTRTTARRILIAALTAVILVLACVGSGAGSTAPGDAESLTQRLSRIVSVRVYHTRIPTVRNSNSRRIARSLASLHPSWVSGLIRYARGQHPNHAEVRAWRKITQVVRAASPQAQFDVTLNARQYHTGDQLTRMMGRVRSELGNDGWFFDFYSPAYRRHPRMIRAAIASAHANGEWIGGNVFGLSNRPPVLPMQSDFLAVQDFQLKLDLLAVQELATQLPIVYHLNNDPDRPRGGGCRFIESFSTARRRALIRHRAAQQRRYGFRVSYPALFPECIRERPHDGGSFLYSYNAFRDPPMAKAIRRLLDRYD